MPRGRAGRPWWAAYIVIAGFGIIAGVGIMFLPVDFWKNTPGWAAGTVGNGVIVGTLLTILLEHGVPNRRFIAES
jgi:xanthine/uracil permease